jgi:hypothetical protein
MDWITSKLALLLGPRMIGKAVAALLGATSVFLVGLGIAPQEVQEFVKASEPVLTGLGGVVVSLVIGWLSTKKKAE